MNTTHELKTWPEFFQAILAGNKTFEVRKLDRNFQINDTLVLREYDPASTTYTGRAATRQITYILTGGAFGVAEGYGVLGMKEPVVTASATADFAAATDKQKEALAAMMQKAAEALQNGELHLGKCGNCGQTGNGQTGEHPCKECGLPTVHDIAGIGQATEKLLAVTNQLAQNVREFEEPIDGIYIDEVRDAFADFLRSLNSYEEPLLCFKNPETGEFWVGQWAHHPDGFVMCDESEVNEAIERRGTLVQELCQRIRLTVALAETEEDGDGFVSAYHFKTGAIHNLLALANDPYNYKPS